eukprot:gene2715-3369_t
MINQIELEGDIYLANDLLVNKDDIKEFECTICTEVLKEPRICPNKHVFCLDCWESALKTKKSCPICRCQTLSTNSLSRNLELEKQFNNLKTYCPNRFKYDGSADIENGCKIESIPLHMVEEHLKKCQFQFEDCKECKSTVLRKSMGEHLESICPSVVVECIYSKYGCHGKYPRGRAHEHLNDTFHHSLIQKMFAQNQTKSTQLETKIKEIDSTCESTKSTSNILMFENHQLSNRIKHLESKLKELESLNNILYHFNHFTFPNTTTKTIQSNNILNLFNHFTFPNATTKTI